MRKIILGLLAGCAILPVSGWAVLGQYQNSITLDQQRMHGSVKEMARQGYSIQKIVAPDGAVVREYVNPDGVVFGVAWQAPTLPNLEQLLGDYFIEFQQAARSSKRRGGPLVVRTRDLIVASGGHMRWFQGRAIALKSLPKNVSQEVVR